MRCEKPPKKKEESKAVLAWTLWLFEVHTLGAMGRHVLLPGCSVLCLCATLSPGGRDQGAVLSPSTPGEVFFSPATSQYIGNPLSFP